MPRNFKINSAYAGAALAAILASNGPIAAAAQPRADEMHRIVRFADLDLTATAGAAALYARITNAAQAVCEPFASDQKLMQEARKCQRQAIERAVTDVNAPALTSYHQMKTMSARDTK